MPISRYSVNPKHRAKKPSQNASVWLLGDWDELRMAVEAAISGWVCPKGCLWNIQEIALIGYVPLGLDMQGELYIGKFVCDNNSEWHGYPVRPKGADIPPAAIIKIWEGNSRISTRDSRLIQQGKF
jgi:hypothetical protein